MTAARWYVVETHPHAEFKAASHLRRQGFDIYLPLYAKRRSHARRVEVVAAPLFPRYLFVAFDIATQRWRSIQSTFGVARMVTHGEAPAPIAAPIIEEIKAREGADGCVRLTPRKNFVPGAKVQILDGAFGSCAGLIEGMTDRERVAVLLDFLGRTVRIVLDAASIVAA